MKKKREYLYVYLVIMIIPLVFAIVATGMRYQQSRIFPLIFSGLIFTLAAIGAINELVKKGPSQTKTEEEPGDKKPGGSWQGYALVAAWTLGFFVAIYLIGFTWAIPLFLLSYMKTHGTGWLTSIIAAVVTGGLVYGIFVATLGIHLYEGFFFL